MLRYCKWCWELSNTKIRRQSYFQYFSKLHRFTLLFVTVILSVLPHGISAIYMVKRKTYAIVIGRPLSRFSVF